MIPTERDKWRRGRWQVLAASRVRDKVFGNLRADRAHGSHANTQLFGCVSIRPAGYNDSNQEVAMDRIVKTSVLKAPRDACGVQSVIPSNTAHGSAPIRRRVHAGAKLDRDDCPDRSRCRRREVAEPYRGKTFTFEVERVEPPRRSRFGWHPYAVDPKHRLTRRSRRRSSCSSSRKSPAARSSRSPSRASRRFPRAARRGVQDERWRLAARQLMSDREVPRV